MRTIYIRFKSLFIFGLIILGVSFVWFSINSLQQENLLAQKGTDATDQSIEQEIAAETGSETESATEAKPMITLLPEENMAQANQERDFFNEYRIERERTQSEQMEILNDIIHNPNSSAQIRTDAQQKLMGLTENLSREAKIESALIAKGFAEAIAVLQEPSVMVIVPSEGFRQDEIARIADIVSKIAECRWEDVIIVPKTK